MTRGKTDTGQAEDHLGRESGLAVVNNGFDRKAPMNPAGEREQFRPARI
jgi:hypothetical protein